MNMANVIKSQAAEVSASKGQKKSMKDLITVMEPAIKAALPSVITPERFCRIVTTALSRTPSLGDCTPASFLGAVMSAAQLGLEPNTVLGQAYLIPYRNRHTGQTECTFQVGYKGLVELAYRSGEVASIQAHAVKQGDEFSFEYGTSPALHHVPAMTGRGEAVAYYAVLTLKSGGYIFAVMSKDDVIEHMTKFSQAAGKGASPWQTDFDEMACKTAKR